jgi:hypothetical protein
MQYSVEKGGVPRMLTGMLKLDQTATPSSNYYIPPTTPTSPNSPQLERKPPPRHIRIENAYFFLSHRDWVSRTLCYIVTKISPVDMDEGNGSPQPGKLAQSKPLSQNDATALILCCSSIFCFPSPKSAYVSASQLHYSA